jgi:O-antigen/teichoic acid export membrane protein
MVYAFQGNTILACAFFIGAFFVPFTDTVSETSQYFFQGKKLYGKSAMVAIATQALFSLPTLCVLFFSDSLILIVATFWVFQAIAGIIIYSTIRPSNELVDPDSTRFGFHLTWMSGLKTVASNIDRVLVWTILGPASVAIYVIANTPFMKLEQLIPIEALTLPELSNQTFTSLLRKQLLIRTGIGLLVMIPVVAIGYFVTPFVFRILFPTFTESIPLFQLLLVGLFFTPFAFLKTGLVAWRKQKALYVLEIISPIIRIALFVVLGIKLGLLGIIIASVVSRGIDGIITGIAFIKSSHES